MKVNFISVLLVNSQLSLFEPTTITTPGPELDYLLIEFYLFSTIYLLLFGVLLLLLLQTTR